MSNSSPGRTNRQHESEAQSQEAGPQQVTQSGEVGDGEVVWIQAPSPQPAHHQAGGVEQNHHLHDDISVSGSHRTQCLNEVFELSSSDLKQSCRQVAEDEGGRHGGVASLQEVDGVQKEEVTRDYQGDQYSG